MNFKEQMQQETAMDYVGGQQAKAAMQGQGYGVASQASAQNMAIVPPPPLLDEINQKIQRLTEACGGLNADLRYTLNGIFGPEPQGTEGCDPSPAPNGARDRIELSLQTLENALRDAVGNAARLAKIV